MSSTVERKLVGITYERQSQHKEASIAQQRRENLEDCERERIDVLRSFDDGTSASRFGRVDRDDWDQVLQYIDGRRVDVLVLWESSRGERRAAEWLDMLELCRQRNILIRIKSDHRTYDMRRAKDWRNLAEDGIDNQYESERMSMRLRRASADSAREGRPHGKAAFGFVREYNSERKLEAQVPDTRPRQSIAEDGSVFHWTAAGIVDDLYKRFVGGESLLSLARWLNTKGVPTPRLLAALDQGNAKRIKKWTGVRWRGHGVRQLLLQCSFAGVRDHMPNVDRRLTTGTRANRTGGVDAVWDHLVAPGTFDAAYNVMAKRDRLKHAGTAAKHLLSRIAVCECGKPVEGGSPSRRVGEYRCINGHTGISEIEVDRYVTTWVIARLMDSANFVAILGDGNDARAREALAKIEEYEGDLRRLEASIDDVDSDIDLTVASRRERAIRAAIDRERAALAAVHVHPVLRDMIGPQAAAMFTAATMQVRRYVVRRVARVTIKRARQGTRPPVEDRVIIEPAD